MAVLITKFRARACGFGTSSVLIGIKGLKVNRSGKFKWVADRVGRFVAGAGVVGVLGLVSALVAPTVSAHEIISVSPECSSGVVVVTVADFFTNGEIEVTNSTTGLTFPEPQKLVSGSTDYADFNIGTIGGNGSYTAGQWQGGKVIADPTPVPFQVSCAKGNPTMTTDASPTVSLQIGAASAVGDTATLSGGWIAPTGSVSFALYAASSCSDGTAVATGTGTIRTSEGVSTASYSTSWAPSSAGTYDWVASYGGDSNNNGFTTVCGAAHEELTVESASPTITTLANPTVADLSGVSSVGDTATFADTTLAAPTGNVSFALYSASSCSSGTPVASGTGTITTSDGTSTATFSTSWTPSAAGTYDWVASYDGDSNNNAFTTSCGAANEEVTVNSRAGGQLAASITTPVTGAGLFGPGLVGGLAIILGALMITVATRIRRLRSH